MVLTKRKPGHLSSPFEKPGRDKSHLERLLVRPRLVGLGWTEPYQFLAFAAPREDPRPFAHIHCAAEPRPFLLRGQELGL